MIDEKKIIGMIQAKALGCLDEADSVEFHNFIDSGYVFPWEELGIYQSTTSLLPLTLQLEIPQPELKDKVALKLIKLSEELKAKKQAKEELIKASGQQEIIEEDVDEKDDFMNFDEPYVEPPIEIESEPTTEIPDIKLSEPLSLNDPSFNLDDIVLPGYESDKTEDAILENVETAEPFVEIPITENKVEEIKIDNKLGIGEINSVLTENNWIEPEAPKVIAPEVSLTPEIPEIKTTNDAKLVEEIDDPNKPDLTKRSVAEKMFKAIEQDFDMLKYHSEETEHKLKRGLMIAFLIVALLAGLLVVMFFKFSSDIENQQKEIDFLKSRPTSQLSEPTKNCISDLFV